LAIATVVVTSDSVARSVSVKPAVSGWDLVLTSHLLGFKNFPKEAKIKNENGTVYVQFTIDRDGHLLDSRIARSSCYDDLDEEGLATVRRADPVPIVPDWDYARSRHFHYSHYLQHQTQPAGAVHGRTQSRVCRQMNRIGNLVLVGQGMG
jgi:TonB family protein